MHLCNHHHSQFMNIMTHYCLMRMHFEFIENSNLKGILGVNIFGAPAAVWLFVLTPVAMLMTMATKGNPLSVALILCMAWCKCYDHNQQTHTHTHSKIHHSSDTHNIKSSTGCCLHLWVKGFLHTKNMFTNFRWSKIKKNVSNNSQKQPNKNQPIQ